MSAETRALLGMVGIRVLSGTIELSAAFLMLSLSNLRSALRINAVLGLVGPAILAGATLVGVSGLAGRVPPQRLFLVVAGVGLVLLGTR
ncbi:MAG: DUF2619 domain-containing protein [Bacillota bacterium]